MRFQGRRVPKTSQLIEYLGYAVVCSVIRLYLGEGIVCHTGKHCDLFNVKKLSIALTIEACPQIRNEDLSSLVKPHGPSIECGFVPEARKAFCQKVDKRRGRMAGIIDQVDEAAVVFLCSLLTLA